MNHQDLFEPSGLTLMGLRVVVSEAVPYIMVPKFPDRKITKRSWRRLTARYGTLTKIERQAVRFGNTLYVSQTQYDQLKRASAGATSVMPNLNVASIV